MNRVNLIRDWIAFWVLCALWSLAVVNLAMAVVVTIQRVLSGRRSVKTT
jgi:hypothetical protein